MKKTYLTDLHTIVKILSSFVLIYAVGFFIQPTTASVVFFDFTVAQAISADLWIIAGIAITSTLNIIWARKKGDVRWLALTPMLILIFQILLMLLFDKPSFFDKILFDI